MDYQKAIDAIANTFSDKAQTEKAAKIAGIGLTTYYITKKLYNAYFGPLSHIPSPTYAKFFDISRASLDNPSGTAFNGMHKLIDQYGEVMRFGPNTLIIADREMIKQILITDNLQKGEIYDDLGKNNVETLFSTRDKDLHKHLRRLISPAFSIKYLNSLEEFMHQILIDLVDKIDDTIAANPNGQAPFDIWKGFQCYSLDVVGSTMFNGSFNLIKNESHPVPDAIAYEMRFSAKLLNRPWLIKLLNFGRRGKTIKSHPAITKFMTEVIENRVKGGQKRNDILQILLDTQLSEDPKDRLSDIEIITETILFLIAGSETTSNSLGFAIIELIRHPEALKKLQEEIDTIEFPDPSRPVFNHDQLKNLPYLNAVMNETFRTRSVPASGLDRICDKDVVLGGKLFVPKGTKIICSVYHTHLNEKYWPNASSFIPERWLEGGANANTSPNDLMNFSLGSRNCIGKQFALMEMRLVLATMMKLFDFTPIPEEMIASEDVRHFITLTVASNQFKVLMRRR
ncbi:unnamed protein product [Cunninghamella blakesleeana]